MMDGMVEQADLFSDKPVKRAISLAGMGRLEYFPAWMTSDEARRTFEALRNELRWEQPHIQVYGRRQPIPRLQAWYGDAEATMVYSSTRFDPEPWQPLLQSIRLRLQEALATPFNSVLVNLYRDGNDSVSWHADDEPELGPDPRIASVSLGATRKFSFKPKRKNSGVPNRHLELHHGDLLVMDGATQRFWHHAILKQPKVEQSRINLTFRYVYPGAGGE